MALQTADEASTRVSNLSRAYRVNLNVLALVALFTGAFLVYSLQSQSVAARRTQLAFLRVIGTTRGEVERLLVIEAALFGVLGSLLGILLGLGVAAAALRLLGGDLGSGSFRGCGRRWPSISATPCSSSPWASPPPPSAAGCRPGTRPAQLPPWRSRAGAGSTTTSAAPPPGLA